MSSDPESLYARYERALDGLEAPCAFVDLDALEANARALLRQAAGKPIRVASKSVRSRPLLRRILGLDPGFRGILAYTLPEALWLADHGFDDIVVAYPTTHAVALRELAERCAASPRTAPIPMVDCEEHLDLIEAAAREVTASPPVPVCMELDVGWWPLGGRLARIGPKRSPIRRPEQARELAEVIAARPGVGLVGLMAYEGHVAGVGDRVPGRPLRSAAIRRMQRASMREIAARLPLVVAAIEEVAELRFVNGGGTGSLERTASLPSVTELTAGSGFYAPTLFDTYSSLALMPAAIFALPVVRRPGPGIVTALGGGYPASGAAGKDRLPQPYLPPGLRVDRDEGAGEVQTPLLGSRADRLAIGDRAYMRHAKAGELCERFNSLYLVAGEEVVDEVPTYRGEGRAFL